MTLRPILDALTIPMRLSKFPSPGKADSTSNSTRCERYLAAMGSTFLLASTIIATVYSATGTAFAEAAELTAISRAHTASVISDLTVPAECRIARRFGADRRAASSIAGHPQPVTSTSASARMLRAPDESNSVTWPSTSANSAKRARRCAGKIRCITSVDMANATRGLGALT